MTFSSNRVPKAPRANPNGQLVLASSGEIYGRVGNDVFVLHGVPPDLLRNLLALADGTRSVDTICTELAKRHDGDSLREIVNTLSARHILEDSEADRLPPPGNGSESLVVPPEALGEAVAILGNRTLLDALNRTFGAAGFKHSAAFFLQDFESCATHTFRGLQRDRILAVGALAGNRRPVPTAYKVLNPVSVSSLRQVFEDFKWVVCALEGVPLRAAFDVNQAALESGTPCLFVTASPEEAIIGPTVIRGGTACFRCRVLSTEGIPRGLRDVLPCLPTPMSAGADTLLASLIVRACVEEAASTLGPNRMPARAASLLRITARGERALHPILPNGECQDCAAPPSEAPSVLEHAAAAAATVEIGCIWPISPMAPNPRSSEAYRSVGILGGGTAGYLTALAFRALQPELDVTLIESSAIPIIGVGEATTPELVKFLHSPRFLRREIADLFQRVRPTWKLGIKFRWGRPGDYEFTFPFQRGRLLESHLYESTLNQQSLGAMLMAADRAPVFQRGDNELLSLLHLVRWAYHLDNKRFVRYLQEEAAAAGVHHVDARVRDAELSPCGETIASLITEDGRRLEYDLYVDCSGFRSFLLEEKLGSKFLSYDGTLFTDRAIIGNVQNGGSVKPYTLAETMSTGWCWNIPFEDADHLGYVFSSAFSTVEQATQEMRTKNPGIGDLSLVKFRSGRHEHFWKGNVVALGNAHAFVEPLESTALHMLVLELELLMTHFPASRHDHAVKSVLNRKVSARWDALRWFLGIHYKFNRRLATPFWRTANIEADVSGAEERIALFQERAPLSYRTSLFYTLYPPEFFSDDHAYDTLLLGQQVPARFVEPVENPSDWRRSLALLKHMAASALPQHEVLPYLYAGGERLLFLRNFAEREDSWLHTWLPA
jgi:tryptophan 7-halogenase